MSENGWEEYKRLVLSEIKRNGDRLHQVEKRLLSIDRNIAEIRTKIYMASAVSAMIFSGILTAIFKFLIP